MQCGAMPCDVILCCVVCCVWCHALVKVFLFLFLLSPFLFLSLSNHPYSITSMFTLILYLLPTSCYFSSVDRPPLVRLYRLPDPASLYTRSFSACPSTCTVLSVLFDTQNTDTRLAGMIHALPPPVIEVRTVQHSAAQPCAI